MIKFRKINTLKPFDWLLILGILFLSIFYSILQKEFDIPGTIAAITGVVCVVLTARGNIMNYLFGAVNVMLFAWISFKAGLYGEAALNGLYFFPMQFVGWYNWVKKRDSEESVTVVGRRLKKGERIVLFLLSTVATAIVAWLLDIFEDPQPIKDAATTVLSVIAMFLMVRRYMEQWSLWVVVNIISVAIWVVATVEGEAHAMLMIFMWTFYLINSVNGWITWLKLSRSNM
jgi:nicotinamide mononucleotide transporter PnuC